MDVIGFAIVLIALAAFVARPLYGYKQSKLMPEATPNSLDAALQDLEVDRESGLLDEVSYERERSALEAELAERPSD